MDWVSRVGSSSIGHSSDLSGHFGEHLTIDGYQCDRDKLDDPSLVRHCLAELPAKLKMKKLSAPEVYFAKGNALKDPGGWSGYVIIEESHISIHTFPFFQFVSIDVYTCKNDMDNKYIENFFKNAYEIRSMEKNFIIRGKHFAHLAERAIPAVETTETQNWKPPR